MGPVEEPRPQADTREVMIPGSHDITSWAEETPGFLYNRFVLHAT